MTNVINLHPCKLSAEELRGAIIAARLLQTKFNALVDEAKRCEPGKRLPVNTVKGMTYVLAAMEADSLAGIFEQMQQKEAVCDGMWT